MRGELFINNKDAYATWGIIFGNNSLAALMTPAPSKSYIQNKSALIHGKQVLFDENYRPKDDERNVQITLFLHARNLDEFFARYDSFVEELDKRQLDIKTKYQQDRVYHMLYVSCTPISQFNGRLAKFVLKLNEPNPKNRL